MNSLPKCYLAYARADADEAARFVERYDGEHASFSYQIERKVDQEIENCVGRTALMKKIREKWLGDSVVTIVLIGSEPTWAEHIDWEIAASLYENGPCKPSGLIGITLPSAAGAPQTHMPPRFSDNWAHGTGYARWYRYPESIESLQSMIADALDARTTRADFINNRRALMESVPKPAARKQSVQECPDCPQP